ncbi:MAG: hypothetical protein AAFQ57_00455 [Cyanobacteria bacterium J06626_14]
MVNAQQPQESRQRQSVIDLFDPHQAMRRSRAQVPMSQRPVTAESITALRSSVATNHFHPPHPSSQVHVSGGAHQLDSGIATFNPQTAVQPHDVKSVHSEGVSTLADVLGVTQKDRARQCRKHRAQQKSTDRRPKPARAVRRSGRSPNVSYLLAGGSLLAGLVVVGDVGSLLASDPVSDVCQEVVQADATLSREELSQLISIPERQAKASVREVVSEPHCILPNVEIRKGAIAEREAYPLAFDPNTWVVLLYEGDEYAGYSFSFQ